MHQRRENLPPVTLTDDTTLDDEYEASRINALDPDLGGSSSCIILTNLPPFPRMSSATPLLSKEQLMANKEDPLLKYTVACDAGNFDVIGEVLAEAEKDEGLATAILALHLRFDSNEEITGQLLRVREPEGRA